jgi:hypothetical protein
MKKKPIVATTGHFHAVRFYKDADGLSAIVADFLVEGFAKDQPAVVIATPLHRAAIEAQLTRRGADVSQLIQDRSLLILDAHETLNAFMVDGMPDSSLFTETIGPMIREAGGGRPDCVVRAYGEMVDVLWKDGQTVAATRLETLWNALANSHAFSLLCGYSMGNFYKNAAVEEICNHHSHVISERGEATLMN